MKAAIITLGCKVNQFESIAMSSQLKESGYIMVSPEQADLVVVNTCTVTSRADSEAASFLRRIKKINPTARLVAVGCLAQSHPEFFLETGLADLVLGQDYKAGLLSGLSLSNGKAPDFGIKKTLGDLGAPMPERTRVFFRIQDGCSANCAYCAVPGARGPTRSLAMENVLKGLLAYQKAGLGEVVLSGIHLGHWGHDFEPPMNLGHLFKAWAKVISSGRFMRLRLSSIEPMEMGPVEEALRKYSWLAPHIHTPLQSGCDRILRLMGRPYKKEDFVKMAEKFLKLRPDLGFGTDIMVGFPGESQNDFEESYVLAETLPFSYLHVFPYSERPGTRASLFPDQVSKKEKKNRVRALRALGARKKELFAQAQIGQRHVALVENTLHKPSGRQKVLTGNYLSALLPSETALSSGELIEIKILGPGSFELYEAEICSQK